MNEQEKILFELFVQESLELTDQAYNTLGLLENKYDEELLHELFRIIHSIKGTSVSMGYNKLSEFIHNIESIIVRIKNKELEFDDEIISLLYDCLSKMKLSINRISVDMSQDMEECDICIKINKYIGKDQIADSNKSLDKFYITEYEMLVTDDAVKKEENVYIMKITINENAMMKSMKAFLIISNFNKIGQVLRTHPTNYDNISDDEYPKAIKVILLTRQTIEKVKANIEVASDIDDITIEKFKGKDFYSENESSLFEVRIKKSLQDNELFRRRERSTIRVEISQLDDFYKKLNELIVDKFSLIRIADALSQRYSQDSDFKDMVSVSHNIDTITETLEELFIDIRVYTIRNIIIRLEKLINNLSIRSGKRVQLNTEGNGIKIDRRILELIVDPLVHIMRNAVDHGIEELEERIIKGKDKLATIELRIVHKKNYICFEVSDDGRGIDIDEVKRQVINKGLSTIDEISKMNDQDVLEFIFKPGFSTSKVVSDISGRGVGMDVVKSNVEKLNGIINISTKKDHGTKITIMIPLTLITVPSLVFKNEDDIFALAETSIIDTIAVSDIESNKAIISENGFLYYIYNKSKIPLINLLDGLRLCKLEEIRSNLIIVGLREKRMGFFVDEIMFNKHLIIKYVDENFDKSQNISKIKEIIGTSSIEDGQNAYVPDITSLIKSIE